MKCPLCESVDLAITEREHVEIDYCPRCRGVWLDRGELDKIIERYAHEPRGGRNSGRSREDDRGRDDRSRDRDRTDDRDERRRGDGRRGRTSFLGDLFDVG